MPKYYCEYCGIHLTHSSPGGRKQHASGRNHINKKIEYYSQFLMEYQQKAKEAAEMNDHQIQSIHQSQNVMMGYPEPPQYYMNPPMVQPYESAPRFLPPPPPAEDQFYPPPPPFARPVEKVMPPAQTAGPNAQSFPPPPPPPPSSEPVAEEQAEEPSSSFNPIMKLNIAAAKKIAANTGKK